MWQWFTESARKVVFYAQKEAGRLGENSVSSEHFLLGLVREGTAAPVGSVWPPPPSLLPPIDPHGRDTDHRAAQVLQAMGIPLADVCAAVERRLKMGPGPNGSEMQLTPRGKRVIDLAYDEARTLNSGNIDTQHLLLGLIREEKGVAAQALAELGVTLTRARQEVIQLQGGLLPVPDTPLPTLKTSLPAPQTPPRRAWWHFFRP
jgi:ATP-dependent Clp protease ATP-binding subunit ClpC